jgi:RHS repeat-associated protein
MSEYITCLFAPVQGKCGAMTTPIVQPAPGNVSVIVDPIRAGIIRGRILDGDDLLVAPVAPETQAKRRPLPGVKVEVLGQPRFGFTYTREDGSFDMLAEGGGAVTLVFSRSGFISSQRNVSLDWNGWAVLEDVALVRPSAKSLTLTLNSANAQAYEGAPVTDPGGTRKTSVVFPPNTKIVGVTAPTVVVRGTEFTRARQQEMNAGRAAPVGGAAMPADLPSATGYTFAVDLRVDGKDHVTFENPVFVYVNDLLSLPPGTFVPNGYYDEAAARWVAEDNGTVVKIDAIDTDASGIKRARLSSGSATLSPAPTPSELEQVAKLYAVGAVLWRVPVKHFSTFDFNYGFAPPSCETEGGPCSDDRGGGVAASVTPENQNVQCGSVIECESQVLRESVSLAGTPFGLHYSSARVPGYGGARTLSVEMPSRAPRKNATTGALEPPKPFSGRIGITVFARYGGRLVSQAERNHSVSALPRKMDLTLPADDKGGVPLLGTQDVDLEVAEYYLAKRTQSGGRFSSTASGWSVISSQTNDRSIIKISRKSKAQVPFFDANIFGLGGWSLSPYHFYDRKGGLLYRGDGSVVRSTGASEALEWVAGGGTATAASGPARGSLLKNISDLAVAEDGTLYVAEDYSRNVVLRVWKDKELGWRMAPLFDPTAAVKALGKSTTGSARPTSVAVAPNGKIYVGTRGLNGMQGCYVFSFWPPALNADGSPQAVQAQVFAGTGICRWDNSQGHASLPGQTIAELRTEKRALEQDLGQVLDIAIDRDDNVFFLEGFTYPSDNVSNRLIRRAQLVGDTRLLGLYAGGGSSTNPLDANAFSARLNGDQMAVTRDGTLYVAAVSNGFARIRTDGTFGLIAYPGRWPEGISAELSGTLAYSAWKSGSGTYDHLGRLGGDDTTAVLAGAPGGTATPDDALDTSLPLEANLAVVSGRVAAGPLGHIYARRHGFGPSSSISVFRYMSASAREASGCTSLVPSADESELYCFDTYGRHERTLNAATGAVLYRFARNAQTGQLESVEDAHGRKTLITRPASNRMEITSPEGQKTVLTLDENGHVASMKDPAGNLIGVRHDAQGLLRSFNPEGLVAENGSVFTYDEVGRLQQDRDARQTRAANFGQSLSRVWFGSDTCSTARNLVCDEPASCSPGTDSTDCAGGISGQIVTHQSAEGRKSTYYAYGARDWIMSEAIDPDQTRRSVRTERNTVTTADASGLTRKVTLTDGPRFGRAARYPASVELKTPSGRTLTVSQKRTATFTDTELTASTDETSLGTAKTVITSNKLSSTERRYAQTSAAGRTTEVFTDTLGRPLKVIVPDVEPVLFTYDGPRLTSITQGPRKQTFSYFASGTAQAGFLEKITSALRTGVNQTTTFTRDARGLPLTSTLKTESTAASTTAVTTATWTGSGALDTLAPPGKLAHDHDYDWGLLTRYKAPAVGTTLTTDAQRSVTYDYDLDRDLRWLTAPSITPLEFVKDSSGRPAEVRAGSTSLVRYAYYPSAFCTSSGCACTKPTAAGGCAPGAVQSVSSRDNANMTFAYDGSLVTSVSFSSLFSAKLAWDYDANWRRSAETLTAGSTTSVLKQTYDADGLLTCVSTGDCSAADTAGLKLNYKPATGADNGLLRSTALGTLEEQLTYNTYGELATQTAGLSLSSATPTKLYETSITERDLAGRITQQTETLNGTTRTLSFQYDDLARLKQVTEGSTTRVYTYDTNGNRLTKSGVTGTATIDAQDRLTSYGGSTYTYTAAGQLKTRSGGYQPSLTMEYDAIGNLTKATVTPVGGTAKIITYQYDGAGRRVGRVLGTTTRRWVYRNQLQIAGELDGTGALLSRFVYATRVNVPDYMIRYSGGTQKVYRVITDYLGSVRLVVNVADKTDILLSRTYDEFGIIISQSGSAPTAVPFGYAGGLYDADTGLVRFGARDYEPFTGRWTTKDPIRFEGGANLYAYAAGNPVDLVDLNGRNPAAVAIGAAAATGAVANVIGYVVWAAATDTPVTGSALAGAAVGGAIGGAAALLGPVGAFVGGAVGAAVEDGIAGREQSWANIGVSGLANTVAPAIGNKLSKLFGKSGTSALKWETGGLRSAAMGQAAPGLNKSVLDGAATGTASGAACGAYGRLQTDKRVHEAYP